MRKIDKSQILSKDYREQLEDLKDREHPKYYSKIGDFLVDGTYTFEVGGKNKSFKQIKDIDNSFVVADDIEIGFGDKIPLWLFGFLY